MRLVFDTNVLIAAFVARGACTELFEHCLIAHTAITSKAILNEFSRVLRVKFKATAEEIKLTLELLELRSPRRAFLLNNVETKRICMF